jgi:hypothetical protein
MRWRYAVSTLTSAKCHSCLPSSSPEPRADGGMPMGGGEAAEVGRPGEGGPEVAAAVIAGGASGAADAIVFLFH